MTGVLFTSRRGKRAASAGEQGATETLDLGPFFDAVAIADVSDCGKLLVCHVMGKDQQDRTVEEQRWVGNSWADFLYQTFILTIKARLSP